MRHRDRSVVLLLAATAAGACTTLGPTPATTGLSPRPAPRSGAELMGGILPGHHLSSAVTESPDGAGIPQAAVVLQADKLTGIPGLVAGARVFGESGDAPIEPVLGYRRAFGPDQTGALAAYVYGTRASAVEAGASYEAVRAGGELIGDVRVLPPSRWIEPHLFGSFNATYLSVDGTYCTGPDLRFGEDCAEPPDAPKPMTTASIEGVYAAATVGFAVEVLRNRDSWFHGARAAFTSTGGMMPRVESGVETDREAFFAFGLSLTVGVGEPATEP
jgi:hypothetical protein